MGEHVSNLNKTKLKLPPWIERVSENARESVARWEELKVETIGVAHLIKVGNFIQKFEKFLETKNQNNMELIINIILLLSCFYCHRKRIGCSECFARACSRHRRPKSFIS